MNQPTKTVYVNFYDSINDAKVKAIMTIFTDIIAKHNPDTIYCLFSSGGGLVDPGIVLYNFLRALPVELIMHNTGSIASIANVVFLAANKRFVAKNSSFLFHGANWAINEKASMTRSQLAETLSSVTSAEAKIAGVITERTELTAEEVTALFSQGATIDTSFALERKIATDMKDPLIPKDAIFVTISLP